MNTQTVEREIERLRKQNARLKAAVYWVLDNRGRSGGVPNVALDELTAAMRDVDRMEHQSH